MLWFLNWEGLRVMQTRDGESYLGLRKKSRLVLLVSEVSDELQDLL